MAATEPSASQRKFLRTLLSPEVDLDVAAALERTGVRLELYYQWLGEERFVESQRENLQRYRLSLEPRLHAAIARALDKPERWAVDLLIQMNGLNTADAKLEEDIQPGDAGGLSGPQQLIQRIRRLAELADERFGEGEARCDGRDGDGTASEALSPSMAAA